MLCDCEKQGFTKAMSVIKEACSPSDTVSRAELKQDESKWVAEAQCILPAIARPTVEQIDVSIIRVIKIMLSRTKVLKKKKKRSNISSGSIMCFCRVSARPTSELSSILKRLIRT